jgi:hypothetical protein
MRSRNPASKIIPYVIIGVMVVMMFRMINRRSAGPSGGKTPPAGSAQAMADIQRQIAAPAGVSRKDGIAAVLLLDVSGSMGSVVADADGKKRPKIDIARRCVINVVKQTQRFALENSGQPTLLGLYEFSGNRRGEPPCRPLVALGAPSLAAARDALDKAKADGDTPIGDAIITGKQALDQAGMTRSHILVVTDGENTQGFSPVDVVKAIAALPDDQRPGIYFIAFDIAASVFDPVKAAGAMVLPASNEKELQESLDFLIGNKILLEK